MARPRCLSRLHSGLLAAPLLCAAVLSPASSRAEAPLETYVGYWSGLGEVIMQNGAREQVKCVATYKVDKADQLRQSLRCASPAYSVSAAVDLTISGLDVSGSWEERTYAAVGTIAGRRTTDGFDLTIRGANFNAAMTLTANGCKQQIVISPERLDASRISITLGKC
jgi:hypothetical protein